MINTTRDAPARTPHRCRNCVTPAAAAAIAFVMPRPTMNTWLLTGTGACGICGFQGDVFDVAYLLIQHWKGELFNADGAVVGQRQRPQVSA